MRANKLLLLVASLGSLLLLGWAAWSENFRQEWRLLQREYRRRLPADQAAEFAVQLRQIAIPALKAADRCVSCHLGMAPGEQGIPGDRVFGPHPQVVHQPAEYGCTACHGGQGRATEKADAHGAAPHWPEPMIPARFADAGCGTCHTHLGVAGREVLDRGLALVERHDCLACHRLDGRGGTQRPAGGGGMEGPDLSRAGAAGFDGEWYAGHLARSAAAADGPWKGAVGSIPPEELRTLDAFLATRVGAPGLAAAKSVFHSLGCRGCHMVGGVGGDDGPDLTLVGQRDPGRLDFSAVPGPRALSGWLAEHQRAPARLVPGSLMPYQGQRDEEIEALVHYLLSLRRSQAPEAFWPMDRIRAQRLEEREFAADGATLYGTFCAACHGPRGQGMRYPGMSPFPAIGNPDFLSLAPDELILETIRRGRPGRRMPAWGEKEGGLRPEEIATVAAYVRTLGEGGGPPSEHPLAAARPKRAELLGSLDSGDRRNDEGVAADAAGPQSPAASRRWVQGDREDGGRLFAAVCAACHGPQGEGGEGPALSNPVLLAAATDTYLVETIRRGRRNTSMPGFASSSPAWPALDDRDIHSIVAFIRGWEAGS